MAPLFTIGIPTFNRASFLRQSLAAALAQTLEDVEILVSDNASTDETPEVVRQAGPGVRYIRNPTNLGAEANFARLVEEARGKYFSWLQDDDLIHKDFAARACAGLRAANKITVYASYAAVSSSHKNFSSAGFCGPPFAIDWMNGKLSIIDGRLIAPLSLFVSVAIPPVVAFPTEVIKNVMGQGHENNYLLGERKILAAAAAQGQVAIDPWIAGVFHRHEQQGWVVRQTTDSSALPKDWLDMAQMVGVLIESWGGLRGLPLQGVFEEIPSRIRMAWIGQGHPWNDVHPLCSEVKKILERTIPRKLLPGNDRHRIRDLARNLTPPVLWRLMRRCVRGT